MCKKLGTGMSHSSSRMSEEITSQWKASKEASLRMIDFAETFKIRVVDSDETYAIDEVGPSSHVPLL